MLPRLLLGLLCGACNLWPPSRSHTCVSAQAWRSKRFVCGLGTFQAAFTTLQRQCVSSQSRQGLQLAQWLQQDNCKPGHKSL